MLVCHPDLPNSGEYCLCACHAGRCDDSSRAVTKASASQAYHDGPVDVVLANCVMTQPDWRSDERCPELARRLLSQDATPMGLSGEDRARRNFRWHTGGTVYRSRPCVQHSPVTDDPADNPFIYYAEMG